MGTGVKAVSGAILGALVLGLFSACAATGSGGGAAGGGGTTPGSKGFIPNQPEVPASDDDAYFQKKPEQGEVFRVLIADGNYQLRQVASRKYIRRKRDDNGDRDQMITFQKFSKRYDFTDWDFNALVRVRLNPHSGDIELIKFVAGRTPRAWQATAFIKNDASRLSFSFPKNRVIVRDFRIRYKWRIKRDPELTDEQAKKRAIEFLRGQKKK